MDAVCHSMVTDKGTVCCVDPDVAITLTVEVVLFRLAEPPHPESRVAPRNAAAITTSRNRRLCRHLNPMKQSTAASVVAGKLPGKPGREFSCRTLAEAGVLTVRDVVTAIVPDGVTLAGEKLQDAPEGNPEQLKVVIELNPF
jgi:hypothetical protein